MTKITPVILCGGSGTRLWPSSRKAYPKQFAPLLGEESLYQKTLRRFAGEAFAAPLVMTNEAFRFVCRDQAEELSLEPGRIILEPVGRNTAPAILCAALMLAEDPEALMLVAPSDHLIRDEEAFLDAVSTAAAAAGGGQLVTFGITPTHPETGFGYLELAAPPQPGAATPLRRFVEKPDRERAARMLARGNFLWNAGIFLFRAADILAAFRAHAPDMIAPCEAALGRAAADLGFIRLAREPYAALRAESIDYAVMEKAAGISAVPLSAGWSDLGSWAALHAARLPGGGGEATGAGAAGDGVLCDGPVSALDCRNSLLRSESPDVHLVGLGLENIVAVATRDAVLVADLARSQQVKDVVALLRGRKVAQADEHLRVHRPWGWYESLCLCPGFQVKRIMVKPGGVLSLQSHRHRSEHWVVVEGTAHVILGRQERELKANESVYIPQGEIHRLENRTARPMFLIEVQTGDYLGEDDITRYEDVYNRS